MSIAILPTLRYDGPQTYFEQRADVTRAQAGVSSTDPVIKQGGEDAMRRLVTSHLRLIKRDAIRATTRNKEEYDDVICAGILGFIQGILRFDMTREVKPYTYACFYVRAAVQEDDANVQGMAKTPIMKNRARLPETEEKFRMFRFGQISLDAPVRTQEGQDRTLLEFVANSVAEVPTEPSDLLDGLLARNFSDDERALITARSVANGSTEAGRMLGISRALADKRWRQLLPKLKAAILDFDPEGDYTPSAN